MAESGAVLADTCATISRCCAVFVALTKCKRVVYSAAPGAVSSSAASATVSPIKTGLCAIERRITNSVRNPGRRGAPSQTIHDLAERVADISSTPLTLGQGWTVITDTRTAIAVFRASIIAPAIADCRLTSTAPGAFSAADTSAGSTARFPTLTGQFLATTALVAQLAAGRVPGGFAAFGIGLAYTGLAWAAVAPGQKRRRNASGNARGILVTCIADSEVAGVVNGTWIAILTNASPGGVLSRRARSSLTGISQGAVVSIITGFTVREDRVAALSRLRSAGILGARIAIIAIHLRAFDHCAVSRI